MEKQQNSEEQKQAQKSKKRPSLDTNFFINQHQLSELAALQQSAQILTEEEEKQKQNLHNIIRRHSDTKIQTVIKEDVNPFTKEEIDNFLNNPNDLLNQELTQYANELRDLTKSTTINNTNDLLNQELTQYANELRDLTKSTTINNTDALEETQNIQNN